MSETPAGPTGPDAPPPGHDYPPGHGYPPGFGYPPGYGYPPGQDPRKSRVAAGVLGIVLGGFGVHRFYLGFTTIGVLQIVVTVLTCGLGSIWGFVEGILYLVSAQGYTQDARGIPLRD